MKAQRAVKELISAKISASGIESNAKSVHSVSQDFNPGSRGEIEYLLERRTPQEIEKLMEIKTPK